MTSSFPPPPPNPEPTSPAWWPIGRWGNKQRVVGVLGAAVIVVGLLSLNTSTSREKTSLESPSSPKKYRDYLWRDEICDGEGWDYSGVFVNTVSPRDTYSFELVATLYDGQTLVARDTELVVNLAPGASEAVEFVFGESGTRCVLEMVSFR